MEPTTDGEDNFSTKNQWKAAGCLENPLIVRHILKYLELKDLVSLSLVNKTWLKEARLIIGKGGRSYLRINIPATVHNNKLEELQNLRILLQKSFSVPLFNGLKMLVPSVYVGGETETEVLVTAIHEIISEISCTYVCFVLREEQGSVLMQGLSIDSYFNRRRLMVALIKQIADVVEELDFGWVPMDFLDVAFKFNPDAMVLPKLRFLDFVRTYCSSSSDFFDDPASDGLRRLINAAPNLSRIGGEWSAQELLQLGLPKMCMIERLVVDGNGIEEDAPESLNNFSARCVKALDIYRVPYPTHVPPELVYEQGWFISLAETNRFLQNLHRVILHSAGSLEEVQISFCVLRQLAMMCSSPLNSVTSVKLQAHGETVNGNPSLDCAHLFPRLKSVRIAGDCAYCYRDSPLKCWCDCPDRDNSSQRMQISPTLQNLTVVEVPMSIQAFRQFVCSAQSITSFTWTIQRASCRSVLEFLPSVWECMRRLKEIRICLDGWFCRQNLDAVICGISEQEAESLRKLFSSPTFEPKTLNIVPIRGSLADLKDLENFEFSLREDAPAWRTDEKNAWFMSQVANDLAFRRLGDLRVTLRCNLDEFDETVLDHLKPFVNVVPT